MVQQPAAKFLDGHSLVKAVQSLNYELGKPEIVHLEVYFA